MKNLLKDGDPEVRLRAAQGLLGAKDKAGIPVLIGLLDQSSPDVAWQAEELLHWLAGQGAPSGILGDDWVTSRRKCRINWEKWWGVNKEKLDLNQEDPDHRRPGLFLVGIGNYSGSKKAQGHVTLYGCDGLPRWQWRGLQDFDVLDYLPKGRLRLREGNPNKEKNWRLTLRDMGGKVVWKWLGWSKKPIFFPPVSSGNILLAAWDRKGSLLVREFAPDGQETLSRDYPNRFSMQVSAYMPGGHSCFTGGEGVPTVYLMLPRGKWWKWGTFRKILAKGEKASIILYRSPMATFF